MASRTLHQMAFAVAAALACAACGAKEEATPFAATVAARRAEPSTLAGRWPAPTTTTSTTTTTAPPPAFPDEAGLTVSGPIGPPWPTRFTAADAVGSRVPLYQAPDVPVPGGRVLTNPTSEGMPLVMLVRKEQGDWLQVQIQSRPNGATAWIRRSDVRLRTVPNHVLIQLGARRLAVFNGDREIWSTSVAPGKASSPTPIGAFYVDALTRPGNPDGAYGAYQVSFTGFSTVYRTFGSGNGQVAAHGTNRPELIGTPASHGCVRLSNADITKLVGLAPQGTPVVVVP
ncbi:MAG: hypothetical protein JWM47_1275 [Acidimicrobiales bacterium]|nr:hypothetical protein [Acidimicrobiales bacterium]